MWHWETGIYQNIRSERVKLAICKFLTENMQCQVDDFLFILSLISLLIYMYALPLVVLFIYHRGLNLAYALQHIVNSSMDT